MKSKRAKITGENNITQKSGFGTAPVYFTSISSILGAILFLRMGFATGTLGFFGVLGIIVLGHLITIPTALAISELATNTRVEGGGEYFIISRSFGLKLGSTIGLTLFLSQTISIAFYTIAFAEAFQPLYDWVLQEYNYVLPKQAVSVPTLLILAWIILKKGADSGVKMLYVVNVILLISLGLFFAGHATSDAEAATRITQYYNFHFINREQFFIIFAICFPAFTGMTAGVGLSGNLKNPGKSIPLGTMAGTLTGLIVYILVIWKFSVSATPDELLNDQMIMSKIALYGSIVIPLGLAACTSSSAIGSMIVAPRTLQAIAADNTFPFKRLNKFFAKCSSRDNEPVNSSIFTFLIALIFILLGDVNSVAEVITMFFLITYGTLCLSSFLNHFGAPPSYRPKFRSNWFISLTGFILSVWVMFKINPVYTIVSYIFIIVVYLFIERHNKDKKGLVNIFTGALFQLNRRLQVYMQKHQANMENEEWRPAVICVSANSFERGKIFDLMKWISHKHGFGTYFHYVQGYFSKQKNQEAKEIMAKLVEQEKNFDSTLYIDTMISPSYTSAIAQIIQTPSISGMENNLVIFECLGCSSEELTRIIENINLVKAGNFDIGIYSMSDSNLRPSNGIHVWIRDTDEFNTNYMILLSYIIISHPDWKKGYLKIFLTSTKSELAEVYEDLKKHIAAGRLPITLSNIEIIIVPEDKKISETIAEHSSQAALTIIGFREEIIKHEPLRFFMEYQNMGDILFINSNHKIEIK